MYSFSFWTKNTLAIFQRLVDKVLRGLGDFTEAYIDNIGIFSWTWNDHMLFLNEVLERIKRAGICIKAPKCYLGQNEIKY